MVQSDSTNRDKTRQIYPYSADFISTQSASGYSTTHSLRRPTCTGRPVRAIEIQSGHLWKAAPGCRILLIDSGAVRFDYPAEWVVRPTPKYVFVIDRQPPDDRCLLAVSWRRIPIRALSISTAALLDRLAPLETRPSDHRGNTQHLQRPPLEAAWTETRFIEPVYGNDVCTRMCVARADCTQAVLLLDYREGNEAAIDVAWKILLDTLVIGEYIEDIRSGRKHAKRG